MGLTRRERVADLRELFDVVWVESPAEMFARMTAGQRDRFEDLRAEHSYLVDRGEPSPRLDPALADPGLDPRVAAALAMRNLMRRALRGS